MAEAETESVRQRVGVEDVSTRPTSRAETESARERCWGCERGLITDYILTRRWGHGDESSLQMMLLMYN